MFFKLIYIILFSTAYAISELCPPIDETSFYTTCIYNRRRVPCNQPAQPGTFAAVDKCKSANIVIRNHRLNECQLDGNWRDPFPQCQPETNADSGCIVPNDVGTNYYTCNSVCGISCCGLDLKSSGTPVKFNEILYIECKEGFNKGSYGSNTTDCNGGKWSFNGCLKLCPPVNDKLDTTCFYNRKRVPCNQHVQPKTFAAIHKCKADNSEPIEKNKVNECQQDGHWRDPFPQCQPTTPVSTNAHDSDSGCTVREDDGTGYYICERKQGNNCPNKYFPKGGSHVSNNKSLYIRCAYGYNKGVYNKDQTICKSGKWTFEGCTKCGLVGKSQQELIENGQDALPLQNPWIATIYYQRNENSKIVFVHGCGGTLISPYIVLTAAHCVTNMKNGVPLLYRFDMIRVKFNKTLRQYDEDYGSEAIEVKDIKKPNEYAGERNNYIQDFAVIELMKSVSFTPACLLPMVPNGNADKIIVLNKAIGKVAGFGRESLNGGNSPTLKEAYYQYLDYSSCYEEFDYSPDVKLGYDKFCSIYDAGVSGIHKGDSGSGFIYKVGNIHYVLGVVSVKLLNKVDTFSSMMEVSNINILHSKVEEINKKHNPVS